MITFAAISKPGSRPINEDHISHREGPNGTIFVVADGLGGHGQGDVASTLAVDAVLRTFDAQQEPISSPDLLTLCIAQAQNALIDEQRRQGLHDEMKTTITLLHLQGETAQWAHVGDSRIYTFKKDKQLMRTQDHSVPQMLVAQGVIREQDIRFHEDRNRLIRVLGAEWKTNRIDISEPLALQPPMSFLMCTDGFWEYIEEKEMSKLLKKAASPQEWINAMQRVVVENGTGKNMDNYSAITVFVR